MIWRDIVGYEGMYQISESGKVKKLKQTIITKHGQRRNVPEMVMTNVIDRDGYYRVNLSKNNRVKRHAIHRLLAEYFLEREVGKNLVNHKDGNKLNNAIENLEWCTFTENNNHAFDTGLMTTNIPVSLIDKTTGETHKFRSLDKASKFIGKSHGYLSLLKKRRITEDEFYRFNFIEREKAN